MQKQNPLLRIWGWGERRTWPPDWCGHKRTGCCGAGDAALFCVGTDYHSDAGRENRSVHVPAMVRPVTGGGMLSGRSFITWRCPCLIRQPSPS